MNGRWNPKALALAFALAGLVVGACDGLRGALSVGTSFGAWPAAVALVVGLDVLVGAALGACVGVVLAAAAWGRAVGSTWAQVVSWALAGAAQASVVGSAFLMTGLRKNRFLAGVVIAGAATGAALALALLSPVAARVLSRLHPRSRKSWPRGARAFISPAGALVFAPLILIVVDAILVACAQRAAFPVRRTSVNLRLGSAIAAPLPFLLAWAAAFRVPWLDPRRSAIAALVVFGGAGAYLVQSRWISDFRFVPWRDLAVLVALAGAACAFICVPPLAPKVRARGWFVCGALVALAVLFTLTAASSEPARKVAARSGVAGLALGHVRARLDSDSDGFAAWLGGGDCDDSDPARNPNAKDWPDDGVDQDCDGHDARLEGALSPPFHDVPAAVPTSPNVLLVTVDTLRADHLGVYGYKRPTSPVMDQLARENLLFENGWAHAPSTRFSMPALALARWPSTIDWNLSIFWPGLGDAHPTIGQVFKGMGYQTGAFFAYEYFRRGFARGFERGIDDYRDRLADRHENVGGDPAHSMGTSGLEMADDAISFITAHKNDKWFLWVHFYDPHLQYQKHPGIDFGDSQTDLYDAEVRFTDQQLGRVLDALKAQGVYDKTIVLVTGDHGEMLGEHSDEHGSGGHGYMLYSQVTKVPFIARVPGLPARRIAMPVGHVDVGPTLVNLARGRHEPSFLGHSLVDVMAGAPADPNRFVFQDFNYEGPTEWRGLVTATHHLIWNMVPHNTRECFDHVADPQEMNDLWGTSGGAACVELRETLEAHGKRLQMGKVAERVTSPGVATPAPGHALVASMGSVVRYLGYDVEPERPARGGRLIVTHHFEVLSKVPPGWQLFFHLDGPNGVHMTLPHQPVDGEYGLERWQRGQRIRDREVIDLPAHFAPGTYTLTVGLWRGSERMPVTPADLSDGMNRLKVMTFDLP